MPGTDGFDFTDGTQLCEDMMVEYPTNEHQISRIEKVAVNGNNRVATFIRKVADDVDLTPGSDFWSRCKTAASAFARAEWFEMLNDLNKAQMLRRDAMNQVRYLLEDIRAELGQRVVPIAVQRNYSDENVLTPGNAIRGGYVTRGLGSAR